MTLVGGSVIVDFSPNACWSWRFDELYTMLHICGLVGVGDLKVPTVFHIGPKWGLPICQEALPTDASVELTGPNVQFTSLEKDTCA